MNQKLNELKRPGGTSPRTARTRTALGEALLSLLEEQPFEHITVKQMTGHAGVGYATFFRHYPDKEALLHDLAAHEIGKLLAMTLPILYTADSLASTRALCAYVWEHRRLWRALLTGGAAAILKEEFLRKALQLAEERPNPEPWLPDELAVTFAVTGVVEILAWWLKQSDPPSVQQMAEVVNRLTVTPIFPPEAEHS